MTGQQPTVGEDGEIVERGDQGRFAATPENKTAGGALKAARLSLQPKEAKTQLSFAITLGETLGVPINPTTLSGWETGRRTVPSPVLLAAARVSGQSLDVIVAEAEGEDAHGQARAAGSGSRRAAQDAEVRELRQELSTLRRQYDDFYRTVVEAFSHAGLPFAAPSAPPSERRVAGEASTG